MLAVPQPRWRGHPAGRFFHRYPVGAVGGAIVVALLLVAVFARLEDSTVVNVDSLGSGTAGGYLGIEKRGTKFKSQFGLDDFFAADTLSVYRCGQPTTAYVWAGSGFSKVVMP